MADALAGPLGRRYRTVLEHPEHATGVDRGALAVTGLRRVGPGTIRVRGRLDHPMGSEIWSGTNPAIRLELPDGDGGVVSRVYTVRSFAETPDGRFIDVDVIRHRDSSPAMAWLDALSVGDRVTVLGPRPHFTPRFEPGRPVALFADETAVPALATIFRDWPDAAMGTAWVETADVEAIDDLPVPDTVELCWLRRDADEAPGFTGRLPRAAKDAVFFSAPTVWAAGERAEMRSIRDRFRTGLGLPKHDVQVFGYWRRGLSSTALDRRRLDAYEQALAEGRAFATVDDFDVAD